MKWISSLLLFALATLPGCVTKAPMRIPEHELELEWTDKPNEERFEIVLTSHANRDICFPALNWPGESGRFTGGDNFASVEIAEGVRPEGQGTFEPDCLRGCGETRLKPGEVRRGRISYAAFWDAAEIKQSAYRRLSFSVDAHYCAKALK